LTEPRSAEQQFLACGLAAVYDRGPAWIYQGETVRQIVGDSYVMLSACGLHAARDALRRATARG
jgi:hypothetical protein